MKKLLSVILAGALALTAVSPVMASTDTYVDAAEHVYYEKDFTAFAGADPVAYLADDGTQIQWTPGSSGATLTAVDDVVKGKAFQVSGMTSEVTAIHFESGFTEYDLDALNAATNQSANGWLIYEFDFLDDGTGTWKAFFQEWMNGGAFLTFNNGSVKARNGVTAAYNVGEWNHVVLEYAAHRYSSNGSKGGTMTLWLNGKNITNNAHGSNYTYTTAAAWHANTGLRFSSGASVKFANLKKYQLPTGTVNSINAYSPATAGDVYATITPDADLISFNDTVKTINYDSTAITTAAELVEALPVATGEGIRVIYDLQDGTGVFGTNDPDELAEVPVEYVTKVVTSSVSGDLCKYYTVGEKEAVNIEFDPTLGADTVARTLFVDEDAAATIGALKELITVTKGSSYKLYDASNNDITANDEASLATVATLIASSASGAENHNYPVTYHENTKTFLEMDFADYDAESGLSATNFAKQNPYIWVRMNSGTFSVVDDAEMGHKVGYIDVTGTTWTGFDNYLMPVNPIAGDKVIVETTVKMGDDYASGGYVDYSYGVAGGTGSGGHYDFVFDANDNMFTHKGATGSYTEGEWYHIVSEYTDGMINIWVNGEQVATNVSKSNFNNAYWTNLAQSKFRLAGWSKDFYIKKWKVTRQETGYNPVAEGDVAALTAVDSAIVVEGKTVTYSDGALTAGDLADKLSAGNGTFVLVDADGTEVAGEAPASTVKTAVVRSASTDCVVKYSVVYADVTSAKYTVEAGSISGVLQQTTPEAFLANITVDGEYGVDYELSSVDKYVATGDVLSTASGDYEITVEEIAHFDGTGFIDGFSKGHFSYTPQFVADATRGGDTVMYIPDTHRKYTKADGKEGGQYLRICFPGGVAGTNGSGTPALKPGESANIEFAMKADGRVYGHLIVNNNFVWYLDGEKMGVNQPSSGNNYTLSPFNISPMSYTIGEWMHVVSSVTRDAETGNYSQKLYINGDLVHQGGTATQTTGDALVLEILGYDKDVDVDIWLDDIKYYYTEDWDFDAEWRYGLDVESSDADVVLANGEVWLSNGKTVADAISENIYNVDGTAIDDYAALATGDKFYVFAGPIIKPFAVKEGALGTAVAADGTLTATVGMVDDNAAPALFVAGIGANDKFTNIVKVKKASASDDTIVYDLNSVGADKVKVYVWDASLTSLTSVATYTKTGDSWN